MRTACIALLATTISITGGQSKKDAPILRGKLGRDLDKAISAVPELWGSILVARGGEILLAKGYGAADYKATPNTSRTLHELASVSKQVTATAVLHLIQRGKLKPKDSIAKFFAKVPKDKKPITVYQLLTHTSGISGEIGVPYASTLKRKNYVREMLSKPLASDPGTGYEYCNVGYALLAAIVERVAKQPFEKYCHKYLFKPAGCKETGFVSERKLIKSGRASSRKGPQPGKTAADWYYGWGYRGMGGVVSTVLDMHRWDRALRGERILKRATKKLLFEAEKNFYACGWNVARTPRATHKVHHSGGVQGYGANFVRYLEEDVCIVALCNGGAAAFGVTRVVQKVLFEPVPMRVKIDVSDHGGGGRTVKVENGLTWKATRKGTNVELQLRAEKGVVLELRFASASWGKKFVFDADQLARSARPDDVDRDPKAVLTLFLRGYGPNARITHPFGSVEMQVETRGRDASGKVQIDRRPTLVLTDTRSGGMTGTVKMNAASVRQLRAALRKVVK